MKIAVPPDVRFLAMERQDRSAFSNTSTAIPQSPAANQAEPCTWLNPLQIFSRTQRRHGVFARYLRLRSGATVDRAAGVNQEGRAMSETGKAVFLSYASSAFAKATARQAGCPMKSEAPHE